ncbi:DUF4173 domain-containing protein [Petroclostridium sp. X23]|uniref:DUF4153 domain-containing protein n=1 Tax=Petroclostridium sp. X23 TaxID=3045146 RepID=UPI0024ADC6C9|nr:DUF4173 domain-containing protein [Petroclostridium sp. X23]WHH60869.1 DUF4173 domain-containing protein [Petroclostridium sp. X23]
MLKQGELILYSLILGALYSFLFYELQPGISVIIWVIGLLMFMIYFIKQTVGLKKDMAWLFSIPIFLLSLRYFLSTNTVLDFFNSFVLVFLCVSMSLFLTGKYNYTWTNIRFIEKLFIACLLPVQFCLKPFEWVYKHVIGKRKVKINPNIKKVLLGLLISMPLLLIILTLLASADMVFNKSLSFFPQWMEWIFDSMTIGRIIGITILTLVIANYSYCYAYNLLERENNGENTQQVIQVTKDKKIIDPVIIMTVLTSINVVYLVFSVIQFAYLFGGGANTLPGGFTYAEYARRGFFELLLVTMINFSIILLSMFFTEKESIRSARIIKSLLTIMGAVTYVMIYSSFYRMGLYEQNYGYTRLRIFVYFFLLLETVLLLATLIYIFASRFSLLRIYILTSLIFYIALNYINVDVLIAKRNVDRYFTEQKVDIEYLTRLSMDAVPQVSRLLDASDGEIVQRVSDYLNTVRESLDKPRQWQEFNGVEYRVKKLLSTIEHTK